MMGYKSIHCNSLDCKNESGSAIKALHQKQKKDLVKELVDPICIVSNANEILSLRLGPYVNEEIRVYFEMVSRAVTKTKTIIEELRQETS